MDNIIAFTTLAPLICILYDKLLGKNAGRTLKEELDRTVNGTDVVLYSQLFMELAFQMRSFTTYDVKWLLCYMAFHQVHNDSSTLILLWMQKV